MKEKDLKQKGQEIMDEELDKVNGGSGGYQMQCSECGSYEIERTLDGNYYRCTKCGALIQAPFFGS